METKKVIFFESFLVLVWFEGDGRSEKNVFNPPCPPFTPPTPSKGGGGHLPDDGFCHFLI